MNTDSPADLVLEYTLNELEHHTFQEIGCRLPLEYLQTLPHHDKIDAQLLPDRLSMVCLSTRQPHSGLVPRLTLDHDTCSPRATRLSSRLSLN